MLPCHRRRRLPRIVKYRNWARDVVLSCAKPLNKQEQQRRRGTRNCVVQRNRVHEWHLYDLAVSYSLFNHGLEIFTFPVRIRTRVKSEHFHPKILKWSKVKIFTFFTLEFVGWKCSLFTRVRIRTGKVKISKPWLYGNFETMLNKPVAHPNLLFIKLLSLISKKLTLLNA